MTALGTAAPVDLRARTRATRHVLAALLVGVAIVDALFLLGLALSGGVNTPLVNVGLSLLTQWIPVSVFWLVAVRTAFQQPAVVLAAIGVTVSAIGDTYYSFAMDETGYLPYPSPADIGYLLFYPFMVVALTVIARRRLHGVGRLVVLETAVATVGASAILAVVLDPVIRSAAASDSGFEAAIAIAYPVFDLLLLAVIAGIVSVPTIRTGRRWWSLATGLAIFVIADVVYALMADQGTYLAGTPLDATWSVGLGFITWWVAGAVQPDIEETARSRRAYTTPLPAVAIIAGLAVLIIGTQFSLSWLAVVLAALTVGLGAVPVIFRQAMLGKMLAAQDQALRQLRELDQAKTDMLAAVNHEFRTPLTSINGHVDLLLDGDAGKLPAAATDMLRTIERNGARLQRLIDETFAASRFDESPITGARTRVSVAEVLRGAAERVRPLAAQRKIVIDVDPVDRALVIDADASAIEIALTNLVDNAVKFSAVEGRIELSAELVDGEVVVHVTDAGIGIPTDDIPRLFTRFFRASNVTQSAIPGVGLGLSIAQQIVRAHGGTIDAHSTVDSGTTMVVRLPAARLTDTAD